MKRFAVSLLLGLAPCIVLAASSGVTTCKDAAGKTYSGNPRPRECTTPSDAEIEAAIEVKVQEEELERQRRERKRQQGLLVKQFPNAAALAAARARDLDPIQLRLATSVANEANVLDERKMLEQKLEFFRPPHRAPPDLQDKVDANDASREAATRISAGIRREIDAVNATWDDRLAQLRPLWAARR